MRNNVTTLSGLKLCILMFGQLAGHIVTAHITAKVSGSDL
jgi:hypothetical protein